MFYLVSHRASYYFLLQVASLLGFYLQNVLLKFVSIVLYNEICTCTFTIRLL